MDLIPIADPNSEKYNGNYHRVTHWPQGAHEADLVALQRLPEGGMTLKPPHREGRSEPVS